MREVGRVLVVVLMAALTLCGLSALACYTPADKYAVEVVLNKPGVKYDLSKLEGVEGVSSVEYFGAYSAYAYRSHYDSRLIVVVSVQGLRYAGVQASDTRPVTMFSVKGLDVSLEQLGSSIEKAATELGWKVAPVPLPPVPSGRALGVVFLKTIDGAEVRVFLSVLEPADRGRGCTVELGLLIKGVDEVSDELASKVKTEIERLLDGVGLSQLKELLKTRLIKSALAKPPPEQEKYVAVRVQIPLRQEVITTTVHACSTSYSSEGFSASELKFEKARELGWSIWVRKAPEDGVVVFMLRKSLGEAKLYVEGKGRGNELYLSLRVEGASGLSAAILSEFKEVLKAVGLSEDLVDKCSFEKFEESRGSQFVPAYDVSEEDLKKALRAELEWLSEVGAVSGLSRDDIEAIVSAVKLGYAGWNSRLVWYNGGWVPYAQTEGAVLLRCAGTPPSFFFPEEELGVPSVEPVGEGGLGTAEQMILACLAVAALVAVAAYLLIKRRILLSAVP